MSGFYGRTVWCERSAFIGFALLSVIPASELALSIVNWDFTLVIPPRLLPQIDTSAGIPEKRGTFVVIPTLLTSESVVEELLEKLEVYSLANQDENIYFALLSDFCRCSSRRDGRRSDNIGKGPGSNQRTKPKISGSKWSKISSLSSSPRNGMKAKENGWDGNANAGNSRNLIACCVEHENTSFTIATCGHRISQANQIRYHP